MRNGRYQSDSSECWYRDDVLHREDGPAVINPDASYWYINGHLHREDGPALLLDDGSKEWYLFGLKCSKDFFDYIYSQTTILVAEPVVVENHILSLRKKFFNR